MVVRVAAPAGHTLAARRPKVRARSHPLPPTALAPPSPLPTDAPTRHRGHLLAANEGPGAGEGGGRRASGEIADQARRRQIESESSGGARRCRGVRPGSHPGTPASYARPGGASTQPAPTPHRG